MQNDQVEEMQQKLQMINRDEEQEYAGEQGQDDEGEGEEEEELIDIDNLADNEKAVLWQYLNEEYQKNPDQLPMPREIVEQFLADNQELADRINNASQQEEQEDEGVAPPADVIDSSEVVVEGAEREATRDDQMYVNEDGNYMVQPEEPMYDGED